MKTQQGIVKTVILLVIALLILSYYGFDLRKTVDSPTTQSNFSYVKTFVVNFWTNYLEKPAKYVWNIFLTYIWTPAFENLKQINAGHPPSIQPDSSMLPVAPSS
jgi:hypothetical protein